MDVDLFMKMAMSALTVDSLVVSVVGGIAFGFLVFGQTVANDSFIERVIDARGYANSTAMNTALLGTVFFLPTIVTSILNADASWPRIVVRLGFWFLFCACLSVGIRLRLRLAHRKAEGRLRSHRS